MFQQIKLLTRMGLYNLFGINEVRHTRDSGKKQRFALLSVVWILIGLLFIFYMILLSLAYISMGMADVLPMYFYTAASMVILFFSFFKAGDLVFSLRSFELQASWPVSTAAIVVSRFTVMYATNLMFSLLVMIPGFIIYGIKLHPAISFYIYGVIGTLFLPMLPLCIALLIGAVIRAIGSRMKHKSVGIALLTLVFSTVIVAVSMIFSMMWGIWICPWQKGWRCWFHKRCVKSILRPGFLERLSWKADSCGLWVYVRVCWFCFCAL